MSFAMENFAAERNQASWMNDENASSSMNVKPRVVQIHDKSEDNSLNNTAMRLPTRREQAAFRAHVRRRQASTNSGYSEISDIGSKANAILGHKTSIAKGPESSSSTLSSSSSIAGNFGDVNIDEDGERSEDDDERFEELLYKRHPQLFKEAAEDFGLPPKSSLVDDPLRIKFHNGSLQTFQRSYSHGTNIHGNNQHPEEIDVSNEPRNATDRDFSAALLRWRLHKQFADEPFSNKDSDWEEKELERVTAEHQRTLARSFQKLMLNAQQCKHTREAAKAITLRRKLETLDSWCKAYRAVRMYRLRTLYRTFGAWSSLVETERRYSELCVIGDSYFELASKKRAIRQVRIFALGEKRKNLLDTRAASTIRQYKLKFAMRRWRDGATSLQRQRQADGAADAYRRMVGLFLGLDTLRKHASLSIRARIVRHTARRRCAIDALRQWRASLDAQTRMELKIESAQLMYEYQLSKRVLAAWNEVCVEEQIARRTFAFLNRLRLRQALRRLGIASGTRIFLRSQVDKSRRYWQARRSTEALRMLVNNAIDKNQDNDAVALRDVQQMRRSFNSWISIVWLSKCYRVATRHRRRKMVAQGLSALKDNWIVATQEDVRETLATIANRKRCLSNCLRAWQIYTFDMVEDCLVTQAADNLRRLHLLVRTFKAWRDIVLGHADIARAYDRVLTLKTVSHCFLEWHYLSTRWMTYRYRIQNNQMRRALQRWCELTAEIQLHRRELHLAAMFRRKSLLTRAFNQWIDHWYLQKSETYLLGMAARHARQQLVRKVFRKWSACVIDQRLILPLTEHGAQIIFETRIKRRCFQVWVDRVRQSVRLRYHTLAKLNGAYSHTQAEAMKSSFSIHRDEVFANVLYEHALLRRVFGYWRTVTKSKLSRVKLTTAGPKGAWSEYAFLSALSG